MKIKLTGVLVSALLVAGVLVAQEAPDEQSQQPQMMQRMMQQMMEVRRQQMMGERNALLEQLRVSMEKLDEFVVAMESLRGEAKTDAIGEVVAELVRQHKDLIDLVEAQPGMMQQMQMMQMMQQIRGNAIEWNIRSREP